LDEELTQGVLDDVLDDVDKYTSACVVQAGIRGTLERKKTKHRFTEERAQIVHIQRAWRCQLAKKLLQSLRANAAAVRIQRIVRARLARNEVGALRLQRDANEAPGTHAGITPDTLVIRKRTNRAVGTLFVKAGDSAGVGELTKLPGVALDNATVELSRPGAGFQHEEQVHLQHHQHQQLSVGARDRLARCRGTTVKLPSLENALSGKVGQFVEAHVKRPPTFAFDAASVGALRVDMRVGGAVVRSASKIEACNFVK